MQKYFLKPLILVVSLATISLVHAQPNNNDHSVIKNKPIEKLKARVEKLLDQAHDAITCPVFKAEIMTVKANFDAEARAMIDHLKYLLSPKKSRVARSHYWTIMHTDLENYHSKIIVPIEKCLATACTVEHHKHAHKQLQEAEQIIVQVYHAMEMVLEKLEKHQSSDVLALAKLAAALSAYKNLLPEFVRTKGPLELLTIFEEIYKN